MSAVYSITIKTARNEKNLSQESVARQVDISLYHYQQIEHRKSVPSIIIGLGICKVLGLDPFSVDWTKID